MPPPPRRILLFVLAIVFLIVLVQFGLVSIAFDKLGLSQNSAYLLLMSTLAGSMFNLPLFTLRADPNAPPGPPPQLSRLPFFRLPQYKGKVLVTVNVGGALVPVAFSLYLIANTALSPIRVVASILAVAFISDKLSRPLPGVGIGIPMFAAPISAAIIASLLDPEQRAPLAYIGGTLGVLIGADLMRLKDIRQLGSPYASIGGAGSMDGVFLTGIVAVLLA